MRRTLPLLRTFSIADATRFTSTPPHAFTKGPPILRASRPSASTLTADPRKPPPSLQFKPNDNRSAARQQQPPSSPAQPPGPTAQEETPAQKVARLRAARAAAKKYPDISLWDRIVVEGRIWADRVHRVSVAILLLFTLFCVGVTIYALSDMVIYNRRKRRAWYLDQTHAQEQDLVAAIANEKAGLPLTEDQTIVLDREKARFAAEEERRLKPSFWSRFSAPVLGRFRGDDGGEEEEEGGVMEMVEDAVEKVREGEHVVEEKLRETVRGNLAGGGKEAERGVIAGLEQARSRKGGPLDQAAENAVQSVKQKTEGRFSWFGR